MKNPEKKRAFLVFVLLAMFLSATRAEAGITMVKDINPNTPGSHPGGMTALGGFMYFHADNFNYGVELWRSDGTEAGTFMVKDIAPGLLHHSHPDDITTMNGIVYFGAEDGVHGRELWRSDGTEAGTFMVKDLLPGPESGDPHALFALGNTLYFGTSGNDVTNFWRSDGTEAGTFPLTDNLKQAGPSIIVQTIALNGKVYFTFYNEPGFIASLWRSDGSPSGTFRVKALPLPLPFMVVMDGIIYFLGEDELWRSDGTEAGTFVVKEFLPGPERSFPKSLTAADDTLFFTVGSSETMLWRSDGTTAGTRPVKDRENRAVEVYVDIGALDGVAYFAAEVPGAGRELWRSDGTSGGTFMLKDVNPGAFGSRPIQFKAMNGKLFFSADDGTHGRELWQSDGTAAGTFMIADTMAGEASFLPEFQDPSFTEFCGGFYFMAPGPLTGPELWKFEPFPFIPIAVTANGEADLVTHSNAAGDLGITVSIDPSMASGVEADWWLEAVSPGGGHFWYDRTGGWIPSATPHRAYEGPLTAIQAKKVVISNRLPAGLWHFDFSVDRKDGVHQGTICDTVGVVVTR